MGNVLQGPCQCPGQKEAVVDLTIPYPAAGAHANGGTGGSPGAAMRAPGAGGLPVSPRATNLFELRSCCCCSDPNAGQQGLTTQANQATFDQLSARGKPSEDYVVPHMASPYSAEAKVGSTPHNVPPLDLQDVIASREATNDLNSPPQDQDGDGQDLGGGKTANDWAAEQDQFAHMPPLPQGWIRVKSRTTGAIYFCYKETGETTFTEPTGPPAGVAASENAATVAGSGEQAGAAGASGMAAGWVEVMSRSTGQVYYWNSTLQKSQFEFPSADDPAMAPPLLQSQEQGTPPEMSEPLPPGWVVATSKSTGKSYYFHAETQTSQFERPTFDGVA